MTSMYNSVPSLYRMARGRDKLTTYDRLGTVRAIPQPRLQCWSPLMPTPPSPTQNHLLAALPAAEFERLSSHLEWIPMPLGEVLYESGAQLHHV